MIFLGLTDKSWAYLSAIATAAPPIPRNLRRIAEQHIASLDQDHLFAALAGLGLFGIHAIRIVSADKRVIINLKKRKGAEEDNLPRAVYSS